MASDTLAWDPKVSFVTVPERGSSCAPVSLSGHCSIESDSRVRARGGFGGVVAVRGIQTARPRLGRVVWRRPSRRGVVWLRVAARLATMQALTNPSRLAQDLQAVAWDRAESLTRR